MERQLLRANEIDYFYCPTLWSNYRQRHMRKKVSEKGKRRRVEIIIREYLYTKKDDLTEINNQQWVPVYEKSPANARWVANDFDLIWNYLVRKLMSPIIQLCLCLSYKAKFVMSLNKHKWEEKKKIMFWLKLRTVLGGGVRSGLKDSKFFRLSWNDCIFSSHPFLDLRRK